MIVGVLCFLGLPNRGKKQPEGFIGEKSDLGVGGFRFCRGFLFCFGLGLVPASVCWRVLGHWLQGFASFRALRVSGFRAWGCEFCVSGGFARRCHRRRGGVVPES